MISEQRSLSAIMLTDIKGFSSLNQANEEIALDLLQEHNTLIRKVLSLHKGLEIKTIGDAFLVEFKSALAAVRCAVDIQTQLNERNTTEPAERAVLVRIGIHVGDVVHREGDVFGDGVNIAARIEPRAVPGGICISDQVYAQVHNKIDVNMPSMGTPKLKNIDYPIELYHVDLPWVKFPLVKMPPKKKTAGDRESVIVLPFSSLSPDTDREYVGDGIVEELINGLSRVEGLKVIARTTAFSFKGKDMDIRELSRSLGVRYVIEGSIKISGNRMRLNIQFSDATDGSSIFSSKYDREIEDIFDVQDEIALSIIDTLKVKILKTEKPVDVYTKNTEAYMLYLQGRYFWNRRDSYGLEKALEYFNKSLEVDGSNPLLYVGLADTYNLLTDDAGWDVRQTYPLARENVVKALEINEDISEAHATIGYINTLREWNFDAAKRHFAKALDLNPNNVFAHLWRAFYYAAIRDYAEALKECRIAYELDPLALPVINDLGLFHLLTGNDSEALYWHEMALELSPSLWLAEYFKCAVFIKQGDWKKVLNISEDMENIMKSPSYFYGNLGIALAGLGRKKEAEETLRMLEERRAELRVLSFDRGVVQLRLGDLDGALDSFESSVQEMDLRLPYLHFFHGDVEGFLEHPRYTELMKTINLAPYI